MECRREIYEILSELSSGPKPANKIFNERQDLKFIVNILLDLGYLGKNRKGIYLKPTSIELLHKLSSEFKTPELFRCRICKRDLPREAFHKNNTKIRGIQYECKECRKTIDGVRNVSKHTTPQMPHTELKTTPEITDEYLKQLITIQTQQLELFRELAAKGTRAVSS